MFHFCISFELGSARIYQKAVTQTMANQGKTSASDGDNDISSVGESGIGLY